MKQIGTMEFTYTLKKIERKTLLLTVVGKVVTQKNKAIELSDANISGTVVLDKKTGETLNSKMTMDMKMKIISKKQIFNMDMKAVVSLVGTKP
jgi:predicted restriction endonuclease